MLEFSFCVSTNKPNYWQRFCEALSKNDSPVEVIFVGMCSGHKDMEFSVSTKFIETDVNPAQCWEIATRNASGDIICLAADDCIFSPGVVDAAAEAFSHITNMFDMVSARYLFEGNDYLFAMRMFSIPGMPLLPVGGFTFADTHRKIGGIDRRFKAVSWDTDLYMRHCQAGGVTHLLDGHSCNESGNMSNLFPRNGNIDQPTLEYLWRRNGVLGTTRVDEVQPFYDKDILIKNQFP